MKYYILSFITICFWFCNPPNTLSQEQQKSSIILPYTSKIANEPKSEYGFNLDPQGLFSVVENYEFPKFYKGIYLNSSSIKKTDSLRKILTEAKANYVNAVVYDMQDSLRFRPSVFVAANVKMAYEMGIHPIARVVVCYEGFREYPVPEKFFKEALALSKIAFKMGFREIQLDYIRFNDDILIKNLPLKTRYATVEGFVGKVKQELAKMGKVLVTADIFGRIPLKKDDPIGQRLEGLDGVADIVLPMAYPSHYTWSRYLMSNPYETLLMTSLDSKRRLKKTRAVMYIQGFEMKVKYSGLSLKDYIYQQIYAIEDAGIDGYIIWNASQKYAASYEAMRELYSTDKRKERHLLKIAGDPFYSLKTQGMLLEQAKKGKFKNPSVTADTKEVNEVKRE